MNIEVKDEWLTLARQPFEVVGPFGDEDKVLMVIMGCALGTLNPKTKKITILAEWKMYHKSYARLCHCAIFRALGYEWEEDEKIRFCNNQGGLLRCWDFPPKSFDSIIGFHPGAFRGTWPNAERDFYGCDPSNLTTKQALKKATTCLAKQSEGWRPNWRPSNN